MVNRPTHESIKRLSGGLSKTDHLTETQTSYFDKYSENSHAVSYCVDQKAQPRRKTDYMRYMDLVQQLGPGKDSNQLPFEQVTLKQQV